MRKTYARIVPVLVSGLLLALPQAAFACAACITSAENRMAFVQTAVALSLLPLGMVGGTGFWLRKRSKEVEYEEDLD